MQNPRVLFVCSGNTGYGLSPNVTIQALGLEKVGVMITYYQISGKGLKGYLKHLSGLKTFLKSNKFDVVHAHYGLSGIIACLAGAKPLLVTIMGSEVYMNHFFRLTVWLFSSFFWQKTIVQSPQMKKRIQGKRVIVLPNGVDIKKFSSISRNKAREQTGYLTGKHILWVSNPRRKEKNFKLAQSAFRYLQMKDVELNVINNQPYERLPAYYRAADALLLTSRWEGSPNVVKEALASGLPIVATDVGDVKDLINGVEGCHIAKSEPGAVANELKKALAYRGRTNGIEKIRHLDTDLISLQLKALYKTMMGK